MSVMVVRTIARTEKELVLFWEATSNACSLLFQFFESRCWKSARRSLS